MKIMEIKNMNPMVEFTTILSILTDATGAERRVYRGAVRHNSTVRSETLIANAAAKNDINPNLLTYHANVLTEELKTSILGGYRLELDNFLSVWLTASGTFPSADAKWDPDKNVVCVHCAPKGDFRNAVAGMNGRNVTKGNHVILRRITDTVGNLENVIIAGASDNTVMFSGDNMLMTADASDEGVWIEDSKGTVVAKGKVTRSTQTTADCTFESLPEPGAYKICIAARGGLSLEYGVSVASRNITIKANA